MDSIDNLSLMIEHEMCNMILYSLKEMIIFPTVLYKKIIKADICAFSLRTTTIHTIYI